MYRSLNAHKIVNTAQTLRNRIHERFPGSGLSKVSDELLGLSNDALVRAEQIARPNLALRISVSTVVIILVVLIVRSLLGLNIELKPRTLSELAQLIEAGLNDIILLSAAIFFLVTFENRLKRAKTLKAVHELRSLAHIIDMHQLTKDPERLMAQDRFGDTPSSPKRIADPIQLTRYLDYCSEMLSGVSKISAVYVQNFQDATALAAVNEIESLAASLSQKIWQKIMIILSSATRAA